MSIQRSRLVGLQYVRGAAALLVVMYHAAGSVAAYWDTESSILRFFSQGYSGVYLFFVLSGFIIMHAHIAQIGKPSTLPAYFIKRATRIYPVYWVFAAVAFFAHFALGQTVLYQESIFVAGMITLLPFNGPVGNLAVAWTLFHEIIFYALFATMILSGRFGGFVLASWWLMCLAQLLFPYDLPASWSTVLSPINLLFGMGLAIALIFHRTAVPPAGLIGLLGALLFAGTWWLGLRSGVSLFIPYGLASALIIAGLLGVIAPPSSHPIQKICEVFGDASYSIYLSHFLTISVLAKVFHEALPELIGFGVIVVGSLVVGIASYFLIEKPLLQFVRAQSQPTHRAQG